MNIQTSKISAFTKAAIHLIQSVPKGRVATYGQIALLAGNARGARSVSWLLHACTHNHNLPWQRILNAQGKIAFPLSSKQYTLQKNLLEEEGVIFVNGRVDLKQYGWEGPF